MKEELVSLLYGDQLSKTDLQSILGLLLEHLKLQVVIETNEYGWTGFRLEDE